MTYKEYIEKRQKEYNALPIFYAFSNEQFMNEMRKRTKARTLEGAAKLVYRLGDSGGFYLKTDAPIIRDYFSKHDELEDLMKDAVFAEEAFMYEMRNHEYHINWEGDWDVCSCFGRCEYDDQKTAIEYLLEMGYGQETISAYFSARLKFLQEAEENGWY